MVSRTVMVRNGPELSLHGAWHSHTSGNAYRHCFLSHSCHLLTAGTVLSREDHTTQRSKGHLRSHGQHSSETPSGKGMGLCGLCS